MAVKIVSGTRFSDGYIMRFLINKMPLLLFSDRIRFYISDCISDCFAWKSISSLSQIIKYSFSQVIQIVNQALCLFRQQRKVSRQLSLGLVVTRHPRPKSERT